MNKYEYQYRWAEKYVELTDATVRRREELNKMFLIANSGVLTVESYFTFNETIRYGVLCLSGLGIGLCLIWMYISNYYRNLMNAKGKVIRTIETQLDLSPGVWALQLGEKGPSPFHSLSVLEIAMSFPFFMLYAFVALYHRYVNLADTNEVTIFYLVCLLGVFYWASFSVLFVRIFLKKAKKTLNQKKELVMTKD